MKEKKKTVYFLVALAALGGVLYGFWRAYQQQFVEEQHQQTFSQPVPSGLPNFLSASPGAPPPQP